MKKAIIVGGGIGGLAAGLMLSRTGKYAVTVIEKESVVGGLCKTFRYEDFLLDYGPHKFYSVIPGIMDEIKTILDNECMTIEKKNSIYMFNHFLKYPLSMIDLARKIGLKNLIGCVVSMAAVMLKVGKRDQTPSYENYIINRFGRKMYEMVFKPLAEKIWGDPHTLSADIAATRIPSSNIIELALRVVGLKKETQHTDASQFYYPRTGFGRITDRIAEEIIKQGGTILTSSIPKKINKINNTITEVIIQQNDKDITLACDLLISSILLRDAVPLLIEKDEPRFQLMMGLIGKLQCRSALLVYIMLKKPLLTHDHWIFFPQRDLIFSRIFEQKMLSAEMGPSDRTVLCCDFTDNDDGNLWKQTDKQLAHRCIEDLKKIKLIEEERVQTYFVKRFPHFYPRYDLYYKKTIQQLYQELQTFDNLLLTGRVGFYNYNNADHCIDMGIFISEQLRLGIPTHAIWKELEQRVENYRIVD